MSDNREKILESIKIQGEVVRKIKAAKESKDKVCLRCKFNPSKFKNKNIVSFSFLTTL